ncbi:MAG: hypothetical protein ACJ78Q_14845, partial [Chloroflexia bacterium]
PSNDRGADWIKENSRSECKQPIPNKMREPSPGVELPAWDDLFETRVRPITDKEREKLDRLIAQGSKLLGLRDDTASSGDAPDPASVVQLIEKYIVEYRTRAKGKAGDPDVEKALRKLDESLGYLWAEQVCRAYNWDWAAWDWGEGSTPMIKPAGEEFMVNPTAPIRQSLADSWPEPEAGSISRFFTELKQVKSWPNRRISELNSIGWIFAPPWINLRDRKPV